MVFRNSNVKLIQNQFVFDNISQLTEFNTITNNINSMNFQNILTSPMLTNNTVNPGFYKTDGAVSITGVCIFDGQNKSDSVFVMRIGGALSTGAQCILKLINGARASNIYWIVTGATSYGAETIFLGNILSQGAISLGDSCQVNGRLISLGAVSINNSNIYIPQHNSIINLYSLSRFAIWGKGIDSNVDIGQCIILGCVGSNTDVRFSLASPVYVSCDVYNDSNALFINFFDIYSSNNIVFMKGDSLSPNSSYNNGKFMLINAPLGLTIDTNSGIITNDDTFLIGTYQFSVIYISNKVATMSQIIFKGINYVAIIRTISYTITLQGVPSTADYVSFYDIAAGTVISANNTVLGKSYNLLTLYNTNYTTSIGRYLQYNTPDWYGLWVNAYDSVTNSTGYPTSGKTIINGISYVLWTYDFILKASNTQSFYLYGLMNSNTTPYNPTTQYAIINITVS